ncbi:MAG: 23S rRNA methyltransferase, partial [Gammaproteobacteria bacterium]|nr:23S rRNA methyltransferase [Gammaproteobacteria bacterium]
FVQEAKGSGYRSRARFKLEAIDRQDRLLRPGARVVDLGAAPGGWSEYVAERVLPGGQVVALDRLEMPAIAGVEFLLGDFTERPTLEVLLGILQQRPVDLVISDMAPNISGVRSVDQPAAIYLCELAADLAARVLLPGGSLLMKVFEGEGVSELRRTLQLQYQRLAVRKPAASRARSREYYLLAQGLKAEYSVFAA